MTQPTSPSIDRRRNAFRPELADARLEGRVASLRFVAGIVQQVRVPIAPVRKEPDSSLGYETEALLGETVRVFDTAGGWAWGQLQRDGYVGYLPVAALSAEYVAPTHRIKAPATFVYPDASIKTPPLAQLSLNALIAVGETPPDPRFAALNVGGYVYANHIAPVDSFARDYVEVAERMINTPYLWGGRSRTGVDCSGLVQLSFEAAGIACPRDSDMAAAELGERVVIPSDLEGLQRGDVIFWPGHCGIMIDSVMLIHANGHHMSTVIEPLTQAARRIHKSGGGTSASGPEISAIRRLASHRISAP